VPSLLFLSNAARRRQTQRELRGCNNVEELLAFTQRHLGTGSIQRVREIEGALWFLQEELKDQTSLAVCEIGTEYGGTNLLLGHALPRVELLIGVDLWVKHAPHLQAFRPPNQELHLVNGSSYDPRTVARLASLLNGRLLDVLFIDGDHRYEGVKQDFLHYRHFVRGGGFILFHDIVPDANARFGQSTTSWAGGVPLLWHRLKEWYPHHEWVQDPQQDGLGIGALRYDPAVELPDEFINSRDDASIYPTLTFEKTV
jgi:cephalosporin hydroxylase